MDSILEQQRYYHEEIERVEQAIVDLYLTPTRTNKERLAVEHRVNEYLERMRARYQSLLNLYEDKDG
ncbi:uncharacterized protein VTP21DRAFT_10198 [Calcarisporiella thermophila]|uniref:uncharacterized protein n=1 Tax=Calcarisporiella thermophila TaxID=911321 RepID=UPI00374452CD